MLAGENLLWHLISSALKLLSKMRAGAVAGRAGPRRRRRDLLRARPRPGRRYDGRRFAEELEPFLAIQRGVRASPSSSVTPTMRRKRKPRPRHLFRMCRSASASRRCSARWRHAAGALGSGRSRSWRSRICRDQRIRQPAVLGLFALVTLAGAISRISARCWHFALSAALGRRNAPAAAGWYFTGWRGRRRPGGTSGRLGATPMRMRRSCRRCRGVRLQPADAARVGLCLPPARAFERAFSLVVSVMLAACGSHSLLGWDALTNWQFSAGLDVQATSAVRLMQPALWHRDQLIAATGALSALPSACARRVRSPCWARSWRAPAAGGHRPGRFGSKRASNLDAVFQQPRVHARSHRGDAAMCVSSRAGLLRGRLRAK